MTKTMLYLFDADATLRRCTVPGQPCPNRPGEWELLPDVKARLAEIDWQTTAIGIVSNQAGIAGGYMTEGDARQMLMDTLVAAVGEWCPFWPVMLCPHPPSAGCPCRKPSPRMLLDAARFVVNKGLKLTGLDEVLYIGDQVDDYGAAEAAGISFQWAADFFRWRPADVGVVWEGELRDGILARVVNDGEALKALAWSASLPSWIEVKTQLRGAILSAARAGGSASEDRR